jgi:hypothetical protein
MKRFYVTPKQPNQYQLPHHPSHLLPRPRQLQHTMDTRNPIRVHCKAWTGDLYLVPSLYFSALYEHYIRNVLFSSRSLVCLDDLVYLKKTRWLDKVTNIRRLDASKLNVFFSKRSSRFLSFLFSQACGFIFCSFLASRVQEPNEGDWTKLIRVLVFLKTTRDDMLALEADNAQTLTWYVDAAFVVNADMRSHTGSTFSLGKGMIISDSTKQKVNSRSSTEAELIGVDDRISKILWAKRFIEYQGFKIKLNIIYQDNTSTMKLEKNGKASSGKRTRHFDIKYFYVTDLIGRDEVEVIYCPTDDMIADYMTKALTGSKFHFFRDLVMNLTGKYHPIGQQECVGQNARSARAA